MINCPNKSLSSWKKLVKVVGEDSAYTIWNEYDGAIPENVLNKKLDSGIKLKAIDNAIFEQYLTILDSKEYQKQMLRPNTDENIKRLASEMRIREGLDKQSVADLMTIENHIEAKQGAQLGKNILGQVALHSTHHIIGQMADLYVREKPPIFEGVSKLHKDGNTMFNIFRDTKGNLISDTISELVNAAVDVLKDPYIKYAGITEHNVGTFLYLIRAGVPLDDVVYFFNNPIIRRYNKELAKRQFNSTDYNNKIHADIINEFKKDFSSDIEQLNGLSRTVLKDRALDKYGDNNNVDYTVLLEFDRLFQAATKMNELMRVTKFDTQGTGTSFGETKGIADAYNKFVKTNEVEKGVNYIENVDNIFEKDGKKTTMGMYKEVVLEAVDYFDSLYSANNNNSIKTAIETLIPNVKAKDQTFVYNKYISDFATYVVQNMNIMDKSLLHGTSSTAYSIKKILASKNHPLRNNLFLNTIITNTFDDIHKILLLQGGNTNTMYSEQLSDSFTELANIDGNLANNIIKVGILQDGFSKSPFSYLHLIPIEYKLPLVDIYYSSVNTINMSDFDTKFKLKNYRKALPRIYKHDKFDKSLSGWYVHKADNKGNRKVSIKVNGDVYSIENNTITKEGETRAEYNMSIGRSISDYVSPIMKESNVLANKDYAKIIEDVTDRYKRIKPVQCAE